jgi:hypothetical protein
VCAGTGARAVGAEVVLLVALGVGTVAFPCGAVAKAAGVAPVLVRDDLPVAGEAADVA